MKAPIFEEPELTNLKVMDNIQKPEMNDDDDVLIGVKVAGVNPIDNFVVSVLYQN
jgi:NADPH:quinone reductase-like Zn-dependent oxidoreductase